MKLIRILITLCLFILSSTAYAAYSCPTANDRSGGWVPEECTQKQTTVSQSACPDVNDARGGWVPPACRAKKVCADCGVIEKINVVDESATGLGAAAGAVAGGLIGRQIGKDKNKTLSTAIGAVAGGVGGHYAEKKLLKRKRWDVEVLMDDGTHRTVELFEEPAFKAGDKVKVSGDSISKQ